MSDEVPVVSCQNCLNGTAGPCREHQWMNLSCVPMREWALAASNIARLLSASSNVPEVELRCDLSQQFAMAVARRCSRFIPRPR